jgi:hypothetical protein
MSATRKAHCLRELGRTATPHQRGGSLVADRARCAPTHNGARFHDLMDRIYMRDVLWEAWRR